MKKLEKLKKTEFAINKIKFEKEKIETDFKNKIYNYKFETKEYINTI